MASPPSTQAPAALQPGLQSSSSDMSVSPPTDRPTGCDSLLVQLPVVHSGPSWWFEIFKRLAAEPALQVLDRQCRTQVLTKCPAEHLEHPFQEYASRISHVNQRSKHASAQRQARNACQPIDSIGYGQSQSRLPLLICLHPT